MIKYAQLESNDTDYIEELYLLLSNYLTDYPNIFNWFYTKVVPNLNTSRYIIVAIDTDTQQIVGFTIAKNDTERKVCSLYVIEKYRYQGIGKSLLDRAMNLIKLRKPLITVNNKVLDYYLPLFTKYGFSLRYIHRDYYVKDMVEYCFNGNLPDKKESRIVKMN